MVKETPRGQKTSGGYSSEDVSIPLGEVVKETDTFIDQGGGLFVSIPSRGSGKGDFITTELGNDYLWVLIPSRGSCKGDATKF